MVLTFVTVISAGVIHRSTTDLSLYEHWFTQATSQLFGQKVTLICVMGNSIPQSGQSTTVLTIAQFSYSFTERGCLSHVPWRVFSLLVDGLLTAQHDHAARYTASAINSTSADCLESFSPKILILWRSVASSGGLAFLSTTADLAQSNQGGPWLVWRLANHALSHVNGDCSIDCM